MRRTIATSAPPLGLIAALFIHACNGAGIVLESLDAGRAGRDALEEGDASVGRDATADRVADRGASHWGDAPPGDAAASDGDALADADALPPSVDCGLEAGSIVTLASGQSNPAQLNADSTSVYWLDLGPTTGPPAQPCDSGACGAVMKVSACGGSPVTLADTALAPLQLTVDSSFVYWVDKRGLLKLPLAGGAPVTLTSDVNYPGSLTVHGGSVYWLENWGGGTGPSLLRSIAVGGGPVTSLTLTANAYRFAIEGTRVYWTVADAPFASGLYSMPLAGGPMTLLAGASINFSALATDPSRVYWVQGNGYTQTIESALLDGGARTTPAPLEAEPLVLVVSDGELYWMNAGPIDKGAVLELSLEGGAPTTLVSNLNPSDMAVYQHDVYWLNGGSVMKITGN